MHSPHCQQDYQYRRPDMNNIYSWVTDYLQGGNVQGSHPVRASDVVRLVVPVPDDL